MQAFLHKKKAWEYRNQRVLLRLIRTSNDVSVESVKAAGVVTSFLLFLVYKTVQGMLVVTEALLTPPALVRWRSPQEPPETYHEFHQEHLELQMRSGVWRR